jgi:hypothetical protein
MTPQQDLGSRELSRASERAVELLQRGDFYEAVATLRPVASQYYTCAGAAEALLVLAQIELGAHSWHRAEAFCLIGYRQRETAIHQETVFDNLVNLTWACLQQKSFTEGFRYGLVAERIKENDVDLLANMLMLGGLGGIRDGSEARHQLLRGLDRARLATVEAVLRGERPDLSPTRDKDASHLRKGTRRLIGMSGFELSNYLLELLRVPDGVGAYDAWKALTEMYLAEIPAPGEQGLLRLYHVAAATAAAGKALNADPDAGAKEDSLQRTYDRGLVEMGFAAGARAIASRPQVRPQATEPAVQDPPSRGNGGAKGGAAHFPPKRLRGVFAFFQNRKAEKLRKAYADPNADDDDRYKALYEMTKEDQVLFANDFINALWDPSPSVRMQAVSVVRIFYDVAERHPERPNSKETLEAYRLAVPRLWELVREDIRDVSVEAADALMVLDREAFAAYIESLVEHPEERPRVLHRAGMFLVDRGNQLGFYLGDSIAVSEAMTRWLNRNRDRSDAFPVDLAALSWAAGQKNGNCRGPVYRMVNAICGSYGMKKAMSLKDIEEVEAAVEKNLRLFEDVKEEDRRSESLRALRKTLAEMRTARA